MSISCRRYNLHLFLLGPVIDFSFLVVSVGVLEWRCLRLTGMARELPLLVSQLHFKVSLD